MKRANGGQPVDYVLTYFPEQRIALAVREAVWELASLHVIVVLLLLMGGIASLSFLL